MGVGSTWSSLQPALRFTLSFAFSLLVFSQLFGWAQDFFIEAYMYPVSWAAYSVLNAIGIPVELDASMLRNGFCDLVLDGTIYRVIHECTGIFTLLVFLALVAAYPTSTLAKLQGLLIALPAFYTYSSIRLVLIGLVASMSPQWVELTHTYLMILVNLGFSLFIWVYWLEEVVRRD